MYICGVTLAFTCHILSKAELLYGKVKAAIMKTGLPKHCSKEEQAFGNPSGLICWKINENKKLSWREANVVCPKKEVIPVKVDGCGMCGGHQLPLCAAPWIPESQLPSLLCFGSPSWTILKHHLRGQVSHSTCNLVARRVTSFSVLPLVKTRTQLKYVQL